MDQMGEGPSGPDPALPSGAGDGETTRASWGRYPVIRPGLADPANPSLEPATDIAPGQPPTYIPPTYIPPRPQEMDQMGEGSSGPGGALPSGAGDGEATRTSWGRYPVIRPGLADPVNPSLQPATDVAPAASAADIHPADIHPADSAAVRRRARSAADVHPADSAAVRRRQVWPGGSRQRARKSGRAGGGARLAYRPSARAAPAPAQAAPAVRISAHRDLACG